VPSLAELANATRNPVQGITRPAALSKGIAGGGISVTFVVQGDRAVIEHFANIAITAGPMLEATVGQAGTFLANLAAEIHRPNIDTQATFDSINAGVEGSPTRLPSVKTHKPGMYSVDVGPTTFYSRFQEFGFVHYLSGKWIQNPFMMPAADVTQPLFEQAVIQIAEIAATRTFFGGPIAGGRIGPGSHLSGVRDKLYSANKFAGDLKVIGVNLGGFRTWSLTAARMLGDANSLMRGALAQRFTHRFTGRFVSGGLSTTRSAILSGPSSQFSSSAQRIYNRVSGGVLGRGLRF